MEQPTDLELIDKARQGDPVAFSALANRHYLTVYRYAFKWVRAKEDAEDITQEVFIKLAGKIQLFDKRSKFTTWLYRLTANCAVDYVRKNSRWSHNKTDKAPQNGLFASHNPGPENNVISRNILSFIDKLPKKQKEAVLLVFSEGMSHKEAAVVVGCAETTISWRIFQAKRKLRKVMS